MTWRDAAAACAMNAQRAAEEEARARAFYDRLMPGDARMGEAKAAVVRWICDQRHWREMKRWWEAKIAADPKLADAELKLPQRILDVAPPPPAPPSEPPPEREVGADDAEPGPLPF